MSGFDYERAAEELDVPEEYAVEAMFAVGERAPPETLSDELREREQPSDRKPVDEIVHRVASSRHLDHRRLFFRSAVPISGASTRRSRVGRSVGTAIRLTPARITTAAAVTMESPRAGSATHYSRPEKRIV